MNDLNIDAEDVKLLNSKIGLHALLRNKKVDLTKALNEVRYINELKENQEELIKLQKWVIEKKKEGSDPL